MAMNSIVWIPNWFNFDRKEMEEQVLKWTKNNKQEKWQIIFSIKELKEFLHRNSLRKHSDGSHNFFSTSKIIFSWNKVEDDWGIVYKIESAEDFDKILYQAPKTPEEANGIAYLKENI